MTPEEQIISLLDFLKDRSNGVGKIENPPSSDVEWAEWLSCAVEQGIAPFLYFRLKQAGFKMSIPAHILNELQGAYHQNAARNLLVLHETKNAVKKLNTQNIPVIILKGAFLADAVYDNPALRMMSDLDILIPLSNIQDALEVFYDMGYYRLYPPWEETAYNVTLALGEGSIPLEVHWELSSIANDQTLPISAIWENTIKKTHMGAEILAMEPINLLIYLCHHAAIMHLYALGIRTLCDVDVVIRKYASELDWMIIASRAREWGLQRAVALTLRLCWQYLETPMPEIALEQLKIREISQKMVSETIAQISFAKNESNNLLNPDITNFLKRMLSEKTLNKMAAFFFKSLHRPVQLPMKGTAVLDARYFYFKRFQYLIRKYIGAIQKYLHQDQNTTRQVKRQKELLKWLRS
jgi:hypothetical protein